MTKFKIGDTVIATETRKIVSIVSGDAHPFRLSDGNWYAEKNITAVKADNNDKTKKD